MATSAIDIRKLNSNQLLKYAFQQKTNIACTYKWKEFHKWVDNAHGMSHAENRLITRDNVDKYFFLDQRIKTHIQLRI